MRTTNLIRGHIARLPDGAMFVTRDLLDYGTRGAVDQALCMFVRSARITRLARGVFAKAQGLHKQTITVFDVAAQKARAFTKEILTNACDLFAKVQTVSKVDYRRDVTFATSGCSSKFRYGMQIICLKTVAPRKRKLGAGLFGDTLRALWHTGKDMCTTHSVQSAVMKWNHSHRQQLRGVGMLLPQWLHEYFHGPLRIRRRMSKEERLARNQEKERWEMQESLKWYTDFKTRGGQTKQEPQPGG